ncbi:MAG: hypothetical protein FD175_2085 [Beijerinckiaceae bacterium]|nr:MAG: hypothetical protein FD175_2085 [Beijerinckiaceae bacterium]
MTDTTRDWLTVRRGNAPLVISLPHTGTIIPDAYATDLVSPWLARKDADWWIETLYDFAAGLDTTIVRTGISRTVIDVNRDPSGMSLYPGQATTELCPTTTFDGQPLYRAGALFSPQEIDKRYRAYFAPYHAALKAELNRLRTDHRAVVLYDCHSIRSTIPRLFEGELPNFNLGTNSGASCAEALTRGVEAICDRTGFSRVTNGRFKGGYITRSLGAPERGIHALQMELACRGYMREPAAMPDESNWPTPYDPDFAAPMRAALVDILTFCLVFARSHA